MFELVSRRALIVRINSNRVIRSLRRYGLVRYVSRHMHYVVLYVNQDEVETVTDRLEKLRAVRYVKPSYRPDLEMSGVYKLHDEDDKE